MISWPDELVDDIARRRSVLFLGAGISKNSQNSMGARPKDWDEFLKAAANKVTDPTHKNEVLASIGAGDLLTACELAQRHLGAAQFKSLLIGEYSTPGFSPAQIHDDITGLDSRIVITTNFDKIYENRASHLQNNTIIVKTYYDGDTADILRRLDRCVVKMHGTIDTSDKAIFTRTSYARARNEHAEFFRLIDALFLTHTFVFLGASMRDPDIQLLMEDQAYRFPGSRPHYMVTSAGAISPGVLSIMRDSMNISPLTYDPVNYHQELAQSIAVLRSQVDAARLAFSKNLNW